MSAENGIDQYSLRNLTHLVIKGQKENLLPIYFHVSRPNLEWLNEKASIILPELFRLITEHIIDIEKKVTARNAAGISSNTFSNNLCLLNGSEHVRVLYLIDNKAPTHAIFECGHALSPSVSPSGNYEKDLLSVAKFSMLVWLYPFDGGITDIPAEMIVGGV